ncbi:MAG: TIGR04255 family protein [Nitrosospira sp.]|nr:TIGR04255 family protein [Nitrosospira sp.]
MMDTNQEVTALKFRNAPIVETILDIDCDMRPDFDFEEAVNSAGDSFKQSYPVQRARHFTEHEIKQDGATDPQVSIRSGIVAFQFFSDDEKQLVQLRRQGFSFNRLAPYISLDDYIEEMGTAWAIFTGIVQPLAVRAIRLRYINRIMLPLKGGGLELDHYLRLGPRTPEGNRLSLSNFMSRNSVIDSETGHQAAIVLASQQSEAGNLPVILDIMTIDESPPDSFEWSDVESRVQSLRGLKNYLFGSTLTDACMELFQ